MEKDQLGRLLLLLGLTFAFCCLFFYVPDRLGSLPLKRVDLFSELRTTGHVAAIDTLTETWLAEDTVEVDSLALQRAAAEKAATIVLAIITSESVTAKIFLAKVFFLIFSPSVLDFCI